MTLEEFCRFFKDKQEHYPESDSFVKEGYVQKKGGYIAKAKKRGIKIDSKSAEPNQKWHLLYSYFEEKDPNENAKKRYNRLLCPELLLWIAEATGFDINEVAEEARQIIDEGKDGRSRITAGSKIRKKITWEMLEEKINSKSKNQFDG